MPPVIKVTGFIGELPKIESRLLPETAADSALDVRLDDGILTPTRKRHDLAETAVADALTLYQHGSDWYTWATEVHAAPGPVATDRLYYTGDGVPKMRVGAVVHDLALPLPAGGLTGVVSGAGSGNDITRAYVYTWVTDLGEESEPSPVSAQVTLKEGQTVTLSGFVAIPVGTRITKQRIYRTQTGTAGTGLYFIAERAAVATNYVDTIAINNFGEPIPSQDWNAPVDDLKGLIPLPNGMMAAFNGKQIYFAEPYHPHAWPDKYTLTTVDEIVGLGAIGSTLVIMTEGRTQIAAGALPEAMQMIQLEANFPCINSRSIVDLGYSIAYASNDGLVSIDGNGQHSLISAGLFNRDEWQELEPQNFVCSQHQGRYVAFYDYQNSQAQTIAGALLINISPTQQATLTRTAVVATAAFYNIETGALNYVPKGEVNIYRHDAPSQPRREMYWKSKEFMLPYKENFGVAQVDGKNAPSAAETQKIIDDRNAIIARNAAKIAATGGEPGALNDLTLNAMTLNGTSLEEIPPLPSSVSDYTKIRIYADDNLVHEITTLNVPVRLPSGFEARKWAFDVSGTLNVDQVVIGRTMEDIASTP